MPPTPPPNDALSELAEVLGEDNVRTLVRTFLRDFPNQIRELGGADRRNAHRIAHSMKSNSRLMGAMELSQRMLGLEERLSPPEGPGVNADDLAAISAGFETIARPLRAFVGD